MNVLTGFVGTLTEAWGELRVHGTRLFLSLLGVVLAVCAITAVAGLGGIVQQLSTEQYERWGGRAASYQFSGYPGGDIGGAAGVTAASGAEDGDALTFGEAITAAAERYDITYISRDGYGQVSVQFPGGVSQVQAYLVDQPYAEMRRLSIVAGGWFAKDDALRLAPAVVISDVMWQQLGRPDLRQAPTIELTAPTKTQAVIVGVFAEASGSGMPSLYVLGEAYDQLQDGTQSTTDASYALWLPPEIGDELAERLRSDLQSAMGEGYQVSYNRSDFAGQGGADAFAALQILITVVSAIVLVIGSVGYINLAIVTVQQRMREIGIRRTFGATGSRVFAAVLLESVVGTTLAGLVGIGIAVFILRQPLVQQAITGGSALADQVAFPIEAAIAGLAISVFVGCVAGFVPALIATRMRVIDAIRSE